MSQKTDILDSLYYAVDALDNLISNIEGTGRPSPYYEENLVKHLFEAYTLLGKPNFYLQVMRDINGLQGEVHPIAPYSMWEEAQTLRLLPKDDLLRRFHQFREFVMSQIGVHLADFILMREIPLRQNSKIYTAFDVRSVTRKSKLWESVPEMLQKDADLYSQHIKTVYHIEGEPMWMHGTATFSSSEGFKWASNSRLGNVEQAKVHFAALVSKYDWHYIDIAVHDTQHGYGKHYIHPNVRKQILSAFQDLGE